VKEFLSRNGQPFSERLVDEDHTAYDELIARGFRAVPVTVIGTRTVVGFDAEALATALADTD
jgi:glutaredoxin-like protein NrdH